MAFRAKNHHRGFSLLEVILATSLTTVFLAALFAFYLPSAVIYQELTQKNDQKSSLLSVMDTIEKEAAGMLATYVDASQCYALCMVDTLGNRIYYYWDPATAGSQYRNLYRKKESVSNAISCANGKVFAQNLDTTQSSFKVNKALLTVDLAGLTSTTTASLFYLHNTFFPSLKERKYLFTEGFECNSMSSGWTVNSGDNSTWTVSSNGTAYGKYLVVDTENSSGVNTSSIQVDVDLARTASATLSFSYFNDGSIGAPDSFEVDFWDGSAWQTIFTDTSGAMVLTPRSVTTDLSGYTLAQTNKLRFVGSLKTAGSHWYVDGIQVYTP